MNKYISAIVLCAPLWFACTQVANGQVIVNPDGTHSIVTGNIIVNSNGTHSLVTGNVIVNPNGSHSVIHGNILVGPDGSHNFLSERKKRQLGKEVGLANSSKKSLKNREQWFLYLFGGNSNRKFEAKRDK
ncbi:MAG: hypothetical protein ACQUHE_17320 [Bacteroidia bacterium]